MKRISLPNLLAGLLCVFACSAMVGDLLGSRTLKGLGAASAVAPGPKVFCQIKGWESFTCDYSLTAESHEGVQQMRLTPEIYSKLGGPYNRRNAYGAALSFAPILPTNLWLSVFDYGLAPDGPLRAELGISQSATNISIRIEPKTVPSTNWIYLRRFRE